ncbi:MAG: ATPase inhibitor subunit zeta, partial [Hyphomicrobiales bacterium]
MATTFDKREEGFEKQFAHDEELRFKAMARRNKMDGLWAAGGLGKSCPYAECCAKEVMLG